MRAFFCIPLPADVRASFNRTAGAIRAEMTMRASWVRPENYHVTLRFLGEIDPLLTVDLEEAARRIVRRIEPFPLVFDRLGCFPSVERARVLWLGGDAPPQFLGLAASLHHELERLGFPPERKATVVHATLARIKGNPDPKLPGILAASRPETSSEVVAGRIVLMESVLAPDGAIYSPLFTTRFAGGKDDGD